MSANPSWDEQLRELAAYWFARVVDISGLTAAEIGRRAGVDHATIHRLKTKGTTVSGATMDAISQVSGVPLPVLQDKQDYVKLYKRRLTSTPATTADEERAGPVDVLRTELHRQAAAKSKRRQGRGGKR